MYNNQKAQVFSVDFLIALSLFIFAFGTILAAGEFRIYNSKHFFEKETLKLEALTALDIISNSSLYGCEFGGQTIAYSINSDNFPSIVNYDQLKKMTGILDKNIEIYLDETLVMAERTDYSNAVLVQASVLVCKNSTTFSDLNACIFQENCNSAKVSKKVIKLKVTQ